MAIRRNSTSLAIKTAQLALAVPQVVAHRVTRMALAGAAPSPRDRKEFHLMGAEKTAAFTASWNAMAMQAWRANQALTTSLWRAFWLPSLKRKPTAQAVAAHITDAALGILNKGMAPVHRKAVANAKRLNRGRFR